MPACSCMIGCASPAAVSTTRFIPRGGVCAAGITPRPRSLRSQRQQLFERRVAQALPQERLRAEHEQPAAAARRRSCGSRRAARADSGRPLHVREHDRVVGEQLLPPSRDIRRRSAALRRPRPPGCRTCRCPARSCPCGRPSRSRARCRRPGAASGSCARSREPPPPAGRDAGGPAAAPARCARCSRARARRRPRESQSCTRVGAPRAGRDRETPR